MIGWEGGWWVWRVGGGLGGRRVSGVLGSCVVGREGGVVGREGGVVGKVLSCHPVMDFFLWRPSDISFQDSLIDWN